MKSVRSSPKAGTSKQGARLMQPAQPAAAGIDRINQLSDRRKRIASPAKGGSSKQSAELRRRLFVEAYLANGQNATQAAVAAGYSEKTAYAAGSRLLKRVEIADAIAARAEQAAGRAEMTTDSVLRRVTQVASFDRRKLYRPDGTPIPVHELDADTAAAISHGGSHGLVPFDKLKALDMSMRHLGLFERDNAQRPAPQPVRQASLRKNDPKLPGKPPKKRWGA